ncbi:MAG: serpin family protein [Clostridia bacterium]|nr:serpin family protein [Clostridia bacterium]
MKKFIRSFVAVVFAVALACLFACAPVGQGGSGGQSSSVEKPVGRSIDLMAGYTPSISTTVSVDEAYSSAYNAFAAKLFKSLYEGKSELISPLSIEIALSMTANGAKGDTLTEMQNVLFDGADINAFNAYFKAYIASITAVDDVSVSIADSIWFKDDPYFNVVEDFLQTNADYYGAGAYKAPFDDETLAEINGWVKYNTDGMIDKILESIDKDAIMYLINALLFDAKWSDQFESATEDVFKKENGTTTTADYLWGNVNGYYENEYAEGFAKPYGNGRFAFCAMLPKDGVSMSQLVSSLDGNALSVYFSDVAEKDAVYFKMPKFKLDYEADLNDCLCALGMPTAFNGLYADFSGLGTYADTNLYIGFVKHKTAIEVTEAGTKAAAVTIVAIEKNASVEVPSKRHYVYLDRPFIYFILDTETNTPLFMGAYNG